MREREIAKAPTARTAVTRPGQAGRALDSRTAARMGAAYGHSFTHVRIHDDAHGADLAARHQALAVTEGSDIAFAPGAYRPNTAYGDALLAHELAHVQQQRDGGEAPGASHEQDAHDAAVGAMAHMARVPGAKRARPSRTSAIAPQRCKPSWAPEMPAGALTPSNGRAFLTGAQVDKILANSPTTAPYLKTRIETGKPTRCGSPTPERSEGHVHFHPDAEWTQTYMAYVAGKTNPNVDRCDKDYTEEEARAEAPSALAFRDDAKELHLNEATAGLGDPIHEAIHIYQDPSFPDTLGWHAKEGMTEFLAIRVAAEQTPPIPYDAAYDKEVEAIQKVYDAIGLAPLAEAYFNGDLDGLQAAMDAKQPGRYAAWRGFMNRPAPDYASANALFAP